jgi:hypothetical protein
MVMKYDKVVTVHNMKAYIKSRETAPALGGGEWSG